MTRLPSTFHPSNVPPAPKSQLSRVMMRAMHRTTVSLSTLLSCFRVVLPQAVFFLPLHTGIQESGLAYKRASGPEQSRVKMHIHLAEKKKSTPRCLFKVHLFSSTHNPNCQSRPSQQSHHRVRLLHWASIQHGELSAPRQLRHGRAGRVLANHDCDFCNCRDGPVHVLRPTSRGGKSMASFSNLVLQSPLFFNSHCSCKAFSLPPCLDWLALV